MKRYKSDNLVIVDDFGSTPSKVQTSLKTINEDFPGFHIIVVFEPSAGSRVIESFPAYENTFKNCELVILPKFTTLPQSSAVKRFTEDELSQKIKTYGTNTIAILDDSQLDQFLIDTAKRDKPLIILFMGSHSFRKIIVVA